MRDGWSLILSWYLLCVSKCNFNLHILHDLSVFRCYSIYIAAVHKKKKKIDAHVDNLHGLYILLCDYSNIVTRKWARTYCYRCWNLHWRYILYGASCLYPWTQQQKTNTLYSLYLSTDINVKVSRYNLQTQNLWFMAGWLYINWFRYNTHELIFYFHLNSNLDYIRFNWHEMSLL